MDAEKIAKGLSEAQRCEILHHTKSHYRDPLLKWGSAGRQLVDIGLLQFPENPRRSGVRLTPLGLAVRALLKGE